jgi:transposase
MWTPEHRATARREGLRYASDLTDEEWAVVAPMIPPARRGGRPRDVNMREVINGLLYLLWTGCWWQALPRICRRKARCTIISSCRIGTARWSASAMRFTSRCASRRGREASPSAAIIDSQSAKTAQKGGLDGPARLRCGQEGHRPQAVDTLGLLLSVAVHPADIQDRDGAAFALNASTRALFPFIERIFADGGYQGGVPQRRPPPPANESLKSSSAMSCTSSWCYQSGGSSNKPSPGSAAIAASRAISNAMQPPWPHSFASR